MEIPQRSQAGVHLAGLLREPLSPAFPFAAAKPWHARSEHHRRRPTEEHHRRLRGAFQRENRRHQARVRAGASGDGVAATPRVRTRSTCNTGASQPGATVVSGRGSSRLKAPRFRLHLFSPDASQPVLGVRCGLHHCLLRAHALSPGARCCSACARPFARAPHGAPQPVPPHRNHDPALARTAGKPSHRKNTPQRRVGGGGGAENTRGNTHRENHRSGKTHRRGALGGKTALPHHAFRCLHTFHRSGGLSLSGTRDAKNKK